MGKLCLSTKKENDVALSRCDVMTSHRHLKVCARWEECIKEVVLFVKVVEKNVGVSKHLSNTRLWRNRWRIGAVKLLKRCRELIAVTEKGIFQVRCDKQINVTGFCGTPEGTFLFGYLSEEKLKQENGNGTQSNKYLV